MVAYDYHVVRDQLRKLFILTIRNKASYSTCV